MTFGLARRGTPPDGGGGTKPIFVDMKESFIVRKGTLIDFSALLTFGPQGHATQRGRAELERLGGGRGDESG